MTFTGITFYVFKSGKTFHFLGGILYVLGFGMLGLAIAGMLFGFSIGIWYCYLGAALMAGFMLYNTSNILNRYPTTAHVSAAMVLFVTIVVFFKYILIILMSRE
ncbi:MAG: Bax inhibitor-1 family protein [Chloroflexi bacterium]|nr:Bax inhibitor-1 family protein [Chloroflexota bacterium]